MTTIDKLLKKVSNKGRFNHSDLRKLGLELVSYDDELSVYQDSRGNEYGFKWDSEKNEVEYLGKY